MSLSQRLKEAEHERRRSAGLPVDEPADESPPVLDLTRSSSSADVIDLTHPAPVDQGRPIAVGSDGIAYDPVRTGDASSAFGDYSPVVTDRSSSYTCPRCGGPTQIDLVDQVHQTVSLSCLTCFHMFRVEH